MASVRQELILFDSGIKFKVLGLFSLCRCAMCKDSRQFVKKYLSFMYLNTRLSFQAKSIAAECKLNLNVERLRYEWSEFDYLCQNESCLSASYSI